MESRLIVTVITVAIRIYRRQTVAVFADAERPAANPLPTLWRA